MEDEGTLLDEVGGLMNVCGLGMSEESLICFGKEGAAYRSGLVWKVTLCKSEWSGQDTAL